jgi:hypothetical protein
MVEHSNVGVGEMVEIIMTVVAVKVVDYHSHLLNIRS